jgi:hypothetical protein
MENSGAVVAPVIFAGKGHDHRYTSEIRQSSPRSRRMFAYHAIGDFRVLN